MTADETTVAYNDDDLVYVDPKLKLVIGPIEYDKKGAVLKKEMVIEHKDDAEDDGAKKRRRKPKKRYYPWCSYKTAKKVYRIEGKQSDHEEYKSFDDVLKLALKEPFWE